MAKVKGAKKPSKTKKTKLCMSPRPPRKKGDPKKKKKGTKKTAKA